MAESINRRYSTILTSSTPAELLLAYREDEEDFFGSEFENETLDINKQLDSDLEELGGSDSEEPTEDIISTFTETTLT